MSRFSQIGVAKITSSVLVATLLSFGAARAEYTGQPGAAPAGPTGAEQPAQNPALAQFRSTLERFGSVFSHPRYGEVWTPAPGTVQQGWSPYPACHWVYDRQQSAWNYQDPTEWGAIVHHHGRWAFDQQYGWMWVADANYGPGHVYWKNEGASVGWAALTPEGDDKIPTDGWQNQDQQSFSSGCRPSAPPPPSAVNQGAPPAPVYAGPAPSYGGPSYGGPSRPIYASAPPVFVPTRPPVVVVTPPPFPHHPPHVPHCLKFPMSPFCKHGQNDPKPGPNGPKPNPNGPNGPSVFCKNNPMVPMCKPGGGNGGIAAGLCATNPSLPNCKPKPPIVKFAGLHHPGIHRPVFRPNVFRPNVFRPSVLRPHFVRPSIGPHFGGRPTMARPHFQPRPMMSRPSVQPRGFGGARFAGRFRR